LNNKIKFDVWYKVISYAYFIYLLSGLTLALKAKFAQIWFCPCLWRLLALASALTVEDLWSCPWKCWPRIHPWCMLCLVWCCSLKMECEKLAQEKTEMQRHYVMVGIYLCHIPCSLTSQNFTSYNYWCLAFGKCNVFTACVIIVQNLPFINQSIVHSVGDILKWH